MAQKQGQCSIQKWDRQGGFKVCVHTALVYYRLKQSSHALMCIYMCSQTLLIQRPKTTGRTTQHQKTACLYYIKLMSINQDLTCPLQNVDFGDPLWIFCCRETSWNHVYHVSLGHSFLGTGRKQLQSKDAMEGQLKGSGALIVFKSLDTLMVSQKQISCIFNP